MSATPFSGSISSPYDPGFSDSAIALSVKAVLPRFLLIFARFSTSLLPLVLLNVLRTEGFVFLLPQVMRGTVPPFFAVSTTHGDVSTTVLDLLTPLVLRLRPGLSLPLVCPPNIVGFADLLLALYKGV